MASQVELAKQCSPISMLKKYSSDWVIQVFVLRRGSVRPFKNERHEGVFTNIILVDEEGTKIQATLFNDHVDKWKAHLQPNKSYFVINGRLDPVNPNYSSVHKEVEIAFTENTYIKESENDVSTENFSNGFLHLEQAENLTANTIFDVVCMLVAVKPLIGEGRARRREIIVTNQWYNHTTITLWREYAETDGETLEKMKDDKPIFGLCNVKVTFYKGIFGISTIPVSTVLINPMIRNATALRNWRDSLDVENKMVSQIPSKAMRKAKQVKLSDIMDGSLADAEDSYYRFNATITAIINKDKPWYSSCKKCYKSIEVIEKIAACPNCKRDKVEYGIRYCMRVAITAEDQHIRITLFDEAATYLLGCNVEQYIESTSDKKEDSKYYRKMVMSKDKEYSFLVKLATKDHINSGRTLIAEEIQEVEPLDLNAPKEEETMPRIRRKRSKRIIEEPNQVTKKKIKVEKVQ